jgi:hypothetical protein
MVSARTDERTINMGEYEEHIDYHGESLHLSFHFNGYV